MKEPIHYYYEDMTKSLTFDAKRDIWTSSERKEFPVGDGYIPLINNSPFKALKGCFSVQVIDPNNRKGCFYLPVENNIICRGKSESEPGVSIDIEKEGARLAACGLVRPSVDFHALVEYIAYAFNEGSAIEGDYQLSPWFEDNEEEGEELTYKWQIR